jgi:tetratricopeptide (TPR) repeat protein
MKRFIFSCVVFAFFAQTDGLYAQQPLDEEIGFLYVKAEYLSETGRFDEAVANYNKVVSRDSLYKDVLLKRGLAKFALGAFKGAKLDALRYMDLKGISAESAALLARSFEAMGQSEAAIQSMTAAIGMASANKDYYMWRAEMYENDDQISSACKDYDTSAKLGNTSAAIKVKALCGGFIQANTVQSNPTVSTQELNPNSQPAPSENPDLSQTDQPVQTSVDTTQSTETFNQPQGENEVVHIEDSEPVQNLNIPQDDGTINNIVIDDELNIEISGQELGKRSIKETPSILILSEENGKVTVNICVDKQGVVTRAEFNSSLSTIALKSLVNLALRKAKEFEFRPGKFDLQCGIMVFNIKGS